MVEGKAGLDWTKTYLGLVCCDVKVEKDVSMNGTRGPFVKDIL